ADSGRKSKSYRLRAEHEWFHLSGTVEISFRRSAALHRFQYNEHRCRYRALPYVVQPFRRNSGEKELWNSTRDHSAFARTASAVETRAASWRIRFLTLDREDCLGNGRRDHRRLG